MCLTLSTGYTQVKAVAPVHLSLYGYFIICEQISCVSFGKYQWALNPGKTLAEEPNQIDPSVTPEHVRQCKWQLHSTLQPLYTTARPEGKEFNLVLKPQDWCNAYLGRENVLPCLCFTDKHADCARWKLTDHLLSHIGGAGNLLHFEVFLLSNAIWFCMIIRLNSLCPMFKPGRSKWRELWNPKILEERIR